MKAKREEVVHMEVQTWNIEAKDTPHLIDWRCQSEAQRLRSNWLAGFEARGPKCKVSRFREMNIVNRGIRKRILSSGSETTQPKESYFRKERVELNCNSFKT